MVQWGQEIAFCSEMVQAVEADAEKWENVMYYDVENPAIGQRLGVSYLQSNLEYVEIGRAHVWTPVTV